MNLKEVLAIIEKSGFAGLAIVFMWIFHKNWTEDQKIMRESIDIMERHLHNQDKAEERNIQNQTLIIKNQHVILKILRKR